MKDFLFIFVGLLAIALNYYSYRFIKPEYKNENLEKFGVFISSKYFTPLGWKLHIIAIILLLFNFLLVLII